MTMGRKSRIRMVQNQWIAPPGIAASMDALRLEDVLTRKLALSRKKIALLTPFMFEFQPMNNGVETDTKEHSFRMRED